MCPASFQALRVLLWTTPVCPRLSLWIYRQDSTETLRKCDEQHKWGQNVLGAWNGRKGAILSEHQKSFPEEVALNFRTKAKQGRESRGQWWGGPCNTEAGDVGRPWRPWTLFCETWETIGGPASESNLSSDSALSASCIQQNGEKWRDVTGTEEVKRRGVSGYGVHGRQQWESNQI